MTDFDEYLQKKVETSAIALAREALIRRPAKTKFRCPTDPLEQAWLLREFLRGPGAVVASCERTRQIDPDKPDSPVLVCAPDNTDMPCWNCIILVLTGKKKW